MSLRIRQIEKKTTFRCIALVLILLISLFLPSIRCTERLLAEPVSDPTFPAAAKLVAGGWVNLRLEPSTDAEVLTMLPPDSSLEVLGQLKAQKWREYAVVRNYLR